MKKPRGWVPAWNSCRFDNPSPSGSSAASDSSGRIEAVAHLEEVRHAVAVEIAGRTSGRLIEVRVTGSSVAVPVAGDDHIHRARRVRGAIACRRVASSTLTAEAGTPPNVTAIPARIPAVERDCRAAQRRAGRRIGGGQRDRDDGRRFRVGIVRRTGSPVVLAVAVLEERCPRRWPRSP